MPEDNLELTQTNQRIYDLVKTSKEALKLSDNEIAEFEQLLGRGKDDRRQAVQMANDAAKALIQIGVGVFIALGAFLRLAVQSEHTWTDLATILLAAAGALTAASIVCGFYAIGKLFKQGEGRDAPKPNKPQWTTEVAGTWLGLQSLCGALALVAFGFAIVFWDANSSRPQAEEPSQAELNLVVGMPNDVELRYASWPVRLTAEWSNMKLLHGDDSISLGQHAEGQGEISVDIR